MDPYLEDSNIWPGFHHSLADEIKGQLNPHIGPKYYAEVEVRTVVEEISVATSQTIFPDAAILEQIATPAPLPESSRVAVAIPTAPVQRVVQVSNQIKLRAVQVFTTDDNQLVTSIEILSPFNKRSGQGLNEYRRKRTMILRSPVHLIEIDLLRGGERPGPEVNEPPLEAEYILLVNRGRGESDIRLSEIWPVALNEPLPLLPVPLLPPDSDVALDLAQAIKAVYTRAGYDWRINYKNPAPPPELRPEMDVWLEQILEIAGGR
jgi:hypothetical protein